MQSPDFSTSAVRLCTACGLCCNGVLFHTVRMQAGDSPRELAALGLKLKRKRGENYLLQPCPAYRDSCCAVYADRPERCRRFECRQLRRVAAGEIDEATALERIRETQRLVAMIESLLAEAGPTNRKRPLSKRCEKVLAEPLDPFADPETREARNRLTRAMADLETLLDEHFRTAPPSSASRPRAGVTGAEPES